ncbi:Uncharacterised protein [Mycobacterium tuberculosis]|uniref:Uncharacterized protein n=2 Tax=Mycobacterium tuberculosis TaxID=1773 RepID=A0A0U0QPV9_MYCTX|nr:Uncharacterised protein [Mycobacterium tuberculosis]
MANSAADRRMSSRPPLASEFARSSSTSRTGTVPPGAPGANRGRSASGHSMVIQTGAVVSGATAEPKSVAWSGGTPTTGNRNRALSSRAGAP